MREVPSGMKESGRLFNGRSYGGYCSEQFRNGVERDALIAVRKTMSILMMFILPELLVQLIGIDRDLHHIQLMAVEIDHEQDHPLTLGMHEDQGLLVTPAAGLANHPLPICAQFLLDHAIQFVTIHRPGKVLKLRHVHVAHARLHGFAGNQTDEAHEGNARGAHMVAALDGTHHAVKAAVAGGQHGHRNQEDRKYDGKNQQPSHWSPPFLSLSLVLNSTPPRPSSPLMPFSLPRSSMRMGPRIRTMVSSLGSTSRMKNPRVSPFSSLTITSVLS